MIQAQLQSWDIRNNTVLVRADLNVPFSHKTILSDFRLKAFEPTLHALIKQHARIIIATHLGNPSGPDSAYSTQLLIPWFIDRGYAITYAPDIATAHTMTHNSVILLENLRFFPGEKEGDVSFARTLAQLGDYYVNDAFGVLHRSDASVTHVPALFAPTHRSCGLLVEKELRMLAPIATTPERPYVCILGGSKPHTKLPLITHLLPRVDTLALLPGLSNTYEAWQQHPIDTSTHKILLPLDYQVSSQTLSNTTRIIDAHTVQQEDIIISIGPKTVTQLQKAIAGANTIVINGLPGFAELPSTMDGAHALLTAITESHAYTVLCGGDSIARAQEYKVLSRFTYVSTGGGATITYLAGQPLPGLRYL